VFDENQEKKAQKVVRIYKQLISKTLGIRMTRKLV
jgi:hypothetical protein